MSIFSELGQAIIRPLSPFTSLYKPIGAGVSLTGIGAVLITNWREQVTMPIWVYVVLAMLLAYSLLVVFYVAFDKSRLPWCEVGDAFLDVPAKIIHIPIVNGNVRATVSVSINYARDSRENVQHLGHSIEPCWRERDRGYTAVLGPGDRERVYLISLSSLKSGNPTLAVISNKADDDPLPISWDAPTIEQGTVTLGVTVTCRTVPVNDEEKILERVMPTLFVSVAPSEFYPGYSVLCDQSENRKSSAVNPTGSGSTATTVIDR